MNMYNLIKDDIDHTIRNKQHIIQDIFRDYWTPFLEQNASLVIRNVVKHEVSKFISCGSKANGFSFYQCEDCGNYAYVPFTCKSRFCPSCGVNACINRSITMPSRCINVPHRHITFTISNYLWPYFRQDRSLLNDLFDAASYTLLSWFKSLSKSQQFVPGIIATLHTFGRDLKWNPHIHILVTEGAMGRIDSWKVFNHFPYEMLRRRFMTKLLFNLSKKIHSPSFKKLKNFLYKQNYKGFYVYAPKMHTSNLKISLAYITRYTSRPVMAESRIISYDNDFVSFYYDRHEDNQRVEEKIHVFDFIKRLIIHIPEKGFNMIRYYGLYSMKKEKTRTLKRIKEKPIKPTKWIDKLSVHFKCNPLKCSCGNTLKFQFIVHSHSRKLFELCFTNLLCD